MPVKDFVRMFVPAFAAKVDRWFGLALRHLFRLVRARGVERLLVPAFAVMVDRLFVGSESRRSDCLFVRRPSYWLWLSVYPSTDRKFVLLLRPSVHSMPVKDFVRMFVPVFAARVDPRFVLALHHL